ncbi:PIN domain-containing protein [Streptomyces sp. NPDC059637]|uniref:PIN domain-containing protein n=1 Tax=Streptomyces sp. NPDC059637 TaxID=3347752 RepID=UPI00369358F7
MIYLLDTNVVAELTTRAKPDPRVLAWFRSTARPNRFLSVITVAEIEAGVNATTDAVRKARYAQALAAVRHEYANRIAPIGEPEAVAYLTVHKTLKATGTSIDPPDALSLFSVDAPG